MTDNSFHTLSPHEDTAMLGGVLLIMFDFPAQALHSLSKTYLRNKPSLMHKHSQR